MNFINSIVHSPTMGHPNMTAVRKLKCYESIYENTLFLFVHVIAHSCKSVILFYFFKCTHMKIKIKSTFKIYSKQLNSVLIQNPSIRNKCISGRLWLLRYGVQQTTFFGILDHFLPFYLYDNLKNQNFEKTKEILGDIHCSCNTTCDRCNFYFSFWAIFCYFTHMCTINDNHIWCMVPEIWRVVDRNFGHFGPFFALLPP